MCLFPPILLLPLMMIMLLPGSRCIYYNSFSQPRRKLEQFAIFPCQPESSKTFKIYILYQKDHKHLAVHLFPGLEESYEPALLFLTDFGDPGAFQARNL